MAIRIRYNAPVVLTFSLAALAVMGAGVATEGRTTTAWFTLFPPADFSSPRFYLHLFSYVLGHQDWPHFLGNFTFILLLGPALEEKYGGLNLFEMMLVTACITGLLCVFLLKTGLLGASGIVFMFILLSSFANAKQGEIPLTFIIISSLFIGKEVLAALADDRISQLAHIVGGLCGALFGYLRAGREKE